NVDSVLFSVYVYSTLVRFFFLFFFFNATPTPEIYTLSLHDALPISPVSEELRAKYELEGAAQIVADLDAVEQIGVRPVLGDYLRSEEHTSELQSPYDLVCRLLLEKKKKK